MEMSIDILAKRYPTYAKRRIITDTDEVILAIKDNERFRKEEDIAWHTDGSVSIKMVPLK